jgi:hypothetical protein
MPHPKPARIEVTNRLDAYLCDNISYYGPFRKVMWDIEMLILRGHGHLVTQMHANGVLIR